MSKCKLHKGKKVLFSWKVSLFTRQSPLYYKLGVDVSTEGVNTQKQKQITSDGIFESIEGTFDEKLWEISCSAGPLHYSLTFQLNIYILQYFTTKSNISKITILNSSL